MNLTYHNLSDFPFKSASLYEKVLYDLIKRFKISCELEQLTGVSVTVCEWQKRENIVATEKLAHVNLFHIKGGSFRKRC